MQTAAFASPSYREEEWGADNVVDDATDHVILSISLPYLPAFYLDFPYLSN
jgi:hypothetical protein